MNESENSPVCERASDLIAFLYNEADEREARDFLLHLQQCDSCREEVASFGIVRESITAWRDESLAGFVSTPMATKKKSAITAFWQFFDLSPLWLKGATALAAVTFCVLAGFAIVNRDNGRVSSTNGNPNAIYTEQDVDRIVREALAKQEKSTLPVQAPEGTFATVKAPAGKPKKSQAASPNQFARSRRPFSKAEREQLAADLRLLSGNEETLELIGDRINK